MGNRLSAIHHSPSILGLCAVYEVPHFLLQLLGIRVIPYVCDKIEIRDVATRSCPACVARPTSIASIASVASIARIARVTAATAARATARVSSN